MAEEESKLKSPGAISSVVILSGWVLLIIVCLVTILSVVWMSVFAPAAPLNENLVKLAFAASGFLFGSFPTLLKDLLLPK